MLRLVRRTQKQTEAMGANGAPNQALKTAYKQLLQTVEVYLYLLKKPLERL